MGIFNSLLHPRAAGKFTVSGSHVQRKKVTVRRPPHIASPTGRGKGGRKTGVKKTRGPSKSELGMVGQVEAGNVYTTDGGKTWSFLGSRTPGSATRAVLKAEKDGLLSAPGKGSNRPGVTRAGAAAFKGTGQKVPAAKAPILAKTAANKAKRAAASQRAVTKRATAATKRAAAAAKKAAAPAKVAGPVKARTRTLSAAAVATRRVGRR